MAAGCKSGATPKTTAAPQPVETGIDESALDRTANACDDFYQFAVGRWNQQNPIPADQTVWSKRWAGADRNFDVLKNILESLAAKPGRPGTNARKLGDFYGACMDTGAIDAAGAKPLEETMRRIASGWPVLNRYERSSMPEVLVWS